MTSIITNALWMAALATLLLTAGCERSPSGDAAPSGAAGGMPAMPNMPQTAQQPQHVGQGTLNSVDQAAGTVNISHGPIASANWPAMSMSFKLANPSAASGFEAGQRVEFRFTIASGMDATVTELKRVE
jgi:Cu(I)/Ag(I) efflux system periplasmic protein CusF